MNHGQCTFSSFCIDYITIIMHTDYNYHIVVVTFNFLSCLDLRHVLFVSQQI